MGKDPCQFCEKCGDCVVCDPGECMFGGEHLVLDARPPRYAFQAFHQASRALADLGELFLEGATEAWEWLASVLTRELVGRLMLVVFAVGFVSLVASASGWTGILVLLAAVGVTAFVVTGLAWAMGYRLRDLFNWEAGP